MIRTSTKAKYDTAILGAEYESETARFLADRLTARLDESRTVWTRDPAMGDDGATTADDACATARTVVAFEPRIAASRATTLAVALAEQ